ncbi:hypothetical protein ACFP2F_21490 [Hymenobacter artigasi]|uniref:Uncharacterized protein n=1 Tax=Hymenobacter artigasi TaxID=2719616 RepID=A0ABX1HNK1_9BACT|nr:hypothetical protein [Hymenobacter artigasi]NKI91843.1 hypothetical protein [Hymenobacter artigasi]
MNSLSTLAGVTHVLPFHLYDDVKQQPTRCELVVHPAQGWAVATELDNGTAGLIQCQVTLATKICQEYHIDPQALTLFTHYAYTGNYENVYVVRFVSGTRDLFDGIRFLGPRRYMLTPEDVTVLVQLLNNGQAPASEWRALPHAA